MAVSIPDIHELSRSAGNNDVESRDHLKELPKIPLAGYKYRSVLHRNSFSSQAFATYGVGPSRRSQAPEPSCQFCADLVQSAIGLELVYDNAENCRRCAAFRWMIRVYCREQLQSTEDDVVFINVEKSRADESLTTLILQDKEYKTIAELQFCSTVLSPTLVRFEPNGLPVRVNRVISGDTASEQALAWAESCLDSCLDYHSSCGARNAIAMPTRLLDLRKVDVQSPCRSKIYLFATGEVLRYICLSYCWGPDQPVKLLQSTHKVFTQDGIPWRNLPKTLQDAVIFTRRLGYAYLWIDVLCIVQDGDQDKQMEIESMCSIYQGAELTLCASRTTDSRDGCFSKTTQEYININTKDPTRPPILRNVSIRRALPHITYARGILFEPEEENVSFPLFDRG